MSEMLTAVAIIFIIAGPFLLLANRYNLPAAPMLIIGGLFAGFFIDEELLLQLAQFGIALLVFAFGVSIQLSDLQTVFRDSELAAFAQILVLGLIGMGLGIALGLSPGEAMFVGVAVALSSTIVATALLQTEIHTDLIRGRLGRSIQFLQDIFAVMFLLAMGAGVLELDPIVLQLGYGVVFLGAAAIVNYHVFPWITRLAGGSVELMVIGVISTLVVFIGAAMAVEVPMVVGAFAVGLAIRHDRAAYHGLFNGIESIKDFFVAIFFATVGALVVLPFVELEVAASVEKLILVLVIVVLVVIVKPAVTTAILLYRGYEARTATLTGLSTDQVSEFALIIAIEALILGFLTDAVFDAIILAAAITMITSSLTQRYAEDIYRSLADRGVLSERHGKIDALSEVHEDISDHVIVAGYGRKGRQVVDMLEEHGHPYVVIENDPALRDDLRLECESYVFGDATDKYTWEKARAETAKVIISVTGSQVVSRRLLNFDFDAGLILRAPDERVALELLDEGALYVVVPDLLASEQLIKHLSALFSGEMTRSELRAEGLALLGIDEPSGGR